MKLIYGLSYLLLLSLEVTAEVQATPVIGQKYALIIGISKYPQCADNKCWIELSSDNDLKLIRQTLLRQGFPASNILTLVDAQATHDGIKQKLAELTSRLQKGDQVVVHYSGHGQQIYDDNNDEVDHLDETLVAYGAPKLARYETYQGEKHVRDDELGIWTTQLRRAVGPTGHVFLILDSCHSGTASRGQRRQRGGAPPIVPSTFTNTGGSVEAGSALYEDDQRSRGNNELGKFVLLSGALANQSNYETDDDQGNSIGSLTYAVSKAFAQTNKAVSYRSFFATVLNVMATDGLNQTPSIEGDIDFQLFGGSLIAQQPYLNVTKIESGEAHIAGGTLLGIFPGSEISLYPSGTANTKDTTPIAKGEVRAAGPFSTVVTFPSTLQLIQPERVWAFVTRQSYGNYRINVSLDTHLPTRLSQLLTDSLHNQPVLTLVTTGADISLVPAPDGLSLLRMSDSTVVGDPIIDTSTTKLLAHTLERIQTYAIVQFMRGLTLKNNDYRVSVRISPDKPNGASGLNPVAEASTVVIPIGKPAWVTIRNEGTKTFFFNLVDFQPDGIATVVVPGIGQYTPEDLTIKPGESFTFQVEVGLPDGLELYRVFAGPEPFDLRPAFGAFQTRGPQSPIEQLLQAVLNGPTGTRGTVARFDPTLLGSAGNFTFQIVR